MHLSQIWEMISIGIEEMKWKEWNERNGISERNEIKWKERNEMKEGKCPDVFFWDVFAGKTREPFQINSVSQYGFVWLRPFPFRIRVPDW